MKCHEVDYEIIGQDMQVVEIELDPGETVIAEAGAMNYMEDGIGFEAKMGDGSRAEQSFFSKMFSVSKRLFSGDSLFLTHFSNFSEGKKRVAFAAPFPGAILPLNMSFYDQELYCQKDAFLAAAYGTTVDIAFAKQLGSGFWGGEGFILQKLVGDGLAFIHAGGTVIQKQLKNQTLRVDTSCLVAFTRGIEYDIERISSLKSMVFGGEGVFVATLKGTGTIWLQSIPFSRLADRVMAHAPSWLTRLQDE
jgi:uncharacterized protein (TIGR00266 family)